MRILLVCLVALALGAAAPSQQVDGDPVSLITAIYKTYTDIEPGEDSSSLLLAPCSPSNAHWL